MPVWITWLNVLFLQWILPQNPYTNQFFRKFNCICPMTEHTSKDNSSLPLIDFSMIWVTSSNLVQSFARNKCFLRLSAKLMKVFLKACVLCMHVCVFVYACMCLCVYVHMNVCVFVYVYIRMYACVCVYVHMNACVCICVHTYVCMYVCVHARMHTPYARV